MGRMTTAIVFAALILAGSLLYGVEPLLAKVLLGVSVLPLLSVMVGGRGHTR